MQKVRFIFLIFVLLFAFLGLAPAAETAANSRIAEVTVYPDSAMVSRVANLQLAAGDQQVIFGDIIPEIDENSLRVTASVSEGVKVLGAQLKKEFLKEDPAEKVKQLQDEIEKLSDQVNKDKNTINILSEEKQFVDSIRLFSNVQIPKDLVTKIPSTQDLDGLLQFLGSKLKEINSHVIDLELNIRETQKKIGVLQRQLSEISGPREKLRRSIVVDVQAAKEMAIDLKVSYLVRGASWQPIYDARANFNKSEVELVSFGIVRQKTGEDWSDVEMSLSTARPAVGGNMPYVSPWFIRPAQRMRDNEMLEAGKADFARESISQTKAFSEDMVRAKPESVYSQAQEKGVAVVYKLAKGVSVKSDGSDHKLPVSTQALSAKFAYSSYPRAVLSAYLGSRVANAKDLQLLGGRVNIFLDGDYTGSSNIGNIGPGEEFDLYLGADESVKAKREQIEKKVDETLIAGIPSPNRVSTFKYKLTMENYKSKKIDVKLFESLPVSEDDRIKVKITNVSVEPKLKDWKDRKGVWLWEFALEPKAKQEITYTYIIEHPKDMQVEGL
ncbi:MAG: mucoidy inhibitor MuiA family protein [Candidatus Omnitrophota bacterium]